MENRMYLCVENGVATSVLNYEPNVPPSIKVYQITEEQDANIKAGTHYFDVNEEKVLPVLEEILIARKNKEAVDKEQRDLHRFLEDTDWKILRHLRQKTLGQETSLTEEEFFALEQARANAAERIIG